MCQIFDPQKKDYKLHITVHVKTPFKLEKVTVHYIYFL